MTNTKQAKSQSKTSCKWVRLKSVFATRKLAGFADKTVFVDSARLQTRDAFGSPYLGNLENDIGFGYCGKVYDIGTGLYDYGFRDYSPVTARFTTVDPIRDGSNWFSYVVNDPVNYCDPFGLKSLKEYFKENIKTEESTYLQNDSDLWAAGAIEHVEEGFELNEKNIEDKAKELLAPPHGRSKIPVDGGAFPGMGDINDTSTWQYGGVKDGNIMIISGDKDSGYNVTTRNVTKKASNLSEALANAASKNNSQKGPFNGLDKADGIKGWWMIDDRNPKGAAPLINLKALELAQEKNQELNKANERPISLTNTNSSLGNTDSFSNITFDSSGTTYYGFNNFSMGGCTK